MKKKLVHNKKNVYDDGERFIAVPIVASAIAATHPKGIPRREKKERK